jgi:DNA-binding NtrC family response regulator
MTHHVLIAEDDAEMRAVVAESLRRGGYAVTEACDGADALDCLGTCIDRDARPDVVIADVRMPHLTGLHLLASIHELAAPPPVVLITAFGGPDLHAAAMRLGAVAVFDKPFDVDALCASIGALLAPPRPDKLVLPTRVLVVDDCSLQANALAELLFRRGFEVTVATSAVVARAAALELIPEVLVIDVLMPGVDGVTLLTELRALIPNVPAILASGLPDDVPYIRDVLDDNTRYVEKPIDMKRLAAMLGELAA